MLSRMGFYMDESDKGPATGGIARDPGPEVHRNAGSSLAYGSVAHDGVQRFTDTLDVREGFAPSTLNRHSVGKSVKSEARHWWELLNTPISPIAPLPEEGPN